MINLNNLRKFEYQLYYKFHKIARFSNRCKGNKLNKLIIPKMKKLKNRIISYKV